ncbi:3-hydroxyacyl-CoA dehydrogenase family protein [Paenibacillus validus]|uniref:3-hydroxybutyryl-CoA dehydrogenase n=1 Tax=Paenibacillus validus TaxID=44253 RepID=A0A7X3CRS1_9BACL|nr:MULTISPECIES: 3-hydroxyacyl-CoA dehydrogenase family protein [Paenibacillus]MED4601199.1 3-hydroxyacyl-CoA dehydrogenase family protein [Paenibacillus validus]MED4606918.1 3-hydroxyacyl-CoA dehydrogenase family protein [Paenibacillus validus]MUG69264.1 3-hydroxybutyryl-CoA dehydrogenase [Paenibacillus validus]
MNERIIGVVGAGTMGSGIAQLAAQKGFRVVLYDMNDELVHKGKGRIASILARLVEKGKLTEADKETTLANIEATSDLTRMEQAHVVIEAIVEDMKIKQDMFRQLDAVLGPEAILATNTSSLSITSIAQATKRADRVAGMHFFNPAPIMKLVEVVRGYNTSDDTVATLMGLARDFGKEPIEVKKDSPGFIVNRVMIPQFVEAMRLVEEGVATMEDVDKAVKLGLNYPMGPFELQDFAGVDIGLHVLDYFYEEFKDDRFAAPQSLKRVVRAGRLGKKTGAGWYDYNK